MRRQSSLSLHAARWVLSSLVAATALSSSVCAITFSVGPDQTLTYPGNLTSVVDEHTTFIPPAPGSNTYLVFMASGISGQSVGAGPVVLQTSDLQNFTYANGYTSPAMVPSVAFNKCNPLYDSQFDENYSAPGSVMQDPTLPPGNLMMIYEAENHCPGGVWQFPFYVTVGFARSSDNGKTWPPPVNSAFGGPDRYPVLKLSAPEPVSEPEPTAMGNGLPSAFVDGNYLYVVYSTYPGPGVTGDGKLRVARAQLGGSGQLSFLKWYNGAFSQPGLGGLDSGVLPAGCIGFQAVGQISYNDALGLYLFTFVCANTKATPPQGAWYFSTATSLDSQNWTAPQLIENSQFPYVTPCPNSTNQAGDFDGWYPSFMSPGSPAGHTGLTGMVFFLKGCSGSLDRTFNSRVFSIVPPALALATIIPTGNFFPYAGSGSGSAGNGVVTVSAPAGTAWSAVSNVPWITVATGATGTGNGSVTFSVAANATGAQRVGTLTVAGRIFTVTQLGPSPVPGSVPIIEYHDSVDDDYFITADPAEQQVLDAAALSGAVWSRTGMTFKSGGSASVYRFIYRSSTGTNTHFYTVNTAEQSGLLAIYPIWVLESPAAFYMTAANLNQTCPAGTVPVYRAAQEQTGSHRFTTIQSAISEVLNRGWTNEGVAFCAPQ